ncbi:MAG: hypothetical protein Q9195_004653 [Heterodermia aff. obscurata]
MDVDVQPLLAEIDNLSQESKSNLDDCTDQKEAARCCPQPQPCFGGAWGHRRKSLLLARLLRSLGSVGAVEEVGEIGSEAYAPNKASRTLTIPPLAAGVEFCSPKNPTYALDAALYDAHDTKDYFISFLATKLNFQRSFQTYMSGFDEGRTSWVDFYPIEEELAAGAHQDKDAIMFVDIGGGMGHEAVALEKKTIPASTWSIHRTRPAPDH